MALEQIVEEQIDCEPWTDLYWIDHPKKCTALWDSFIECITFHIQTVYCYDAAEGRMVFISNGLKKPTGVLIWDFVQQIQLLNRYLDLLPCLYFSLRASKFTKIIRPFDNTNLASHIFRMVTRD